MTATEFRQRLTPYAISFKRDLKDVMPAAIHGSDWHIERVLTAARIVVRAYNSTEPDTLVYFRVQDFNTIIRETRWLEFDDEIHILTEIIRRAHNLRIEAEKMTLLRDYERGLAELIGKEIR